MSTVHASESIVVVLPDGTARGVQKDQAFDDTDPVVLAHPWLFGIVKPTVAKRVAARVKPPKVEKATANPGEYRDL